MGLSNPHDITSHTLSRPISQAYRGCINKIQRLPNYNTLTPKTCAKLVETSFHTGRRASCQGTELASMCASEHVTSAQLCRTFSRRYTDGNTPLHCRSDPGR